MDLALRPLTTESIPAWHELLVAIEDVDRTGEHYSQEDLAEELANPDIEVGKDVVGAYDGARLVGYFAVLPRGESEGHFTIHVEGAVRPDRRGEGVGTTLVAAMLRRAEEAQVQKGHGLPGRLMAKGMSADTAQQTLLAGVGLLPSRWTVVMRAVLADVPPPAPVPDGYRIRAYDPSMAPAMLAAHNRAFVDHPEFTPWTETMWKQWVTQSRAFRPGVTYVVTQDGSDDLVAYVQSNEYDAYLEATGRREAWVAKVGTLREHRGRGLAGALLQHCLAAYREAGYDEAGLDVDSDNPTGALGVYERAGFEVQCRFTNYTLLTPGG